MVPLGDNGRLPEGPTQVGVAQLGAAQALDLAGAGDGPFDQATVGQEVFDRGEALDFANFVKERQAQRFTDAGHGLEQGVLPRGDLFGLSLKFRFHLQDLMIEVPDHGQVVFEGELARRMVLGGQQLFFPGIANSSGLFGRDAVVGQLMRMNAGQQFGAAPDVVDALAQECAQGPLLRGIDIGRRNEIGTEQVGELFGVDAVILVLAPVNGFDVKSVGQDEFEAGGLAGIGLPVPAEPALAANGQLVPVGLDQLEEEGEVVVFDVGVDQFFALAIHDADVHLAGVPIDSAVELGGGGLILHSRTQCSGVLRTPVDTVRYAGSAANTPRPFVPPMIAQTNKGFNGSIKGAPANRHPPLASAERRDCLFIGLARNAQCRVPVAELFR